MTTIRTREPRELLALIPYQLGFTPRDSAVAVSVRGERHRVGLVARVDLPDLSDPSCGPELARSLVGHLLADGAASAVLVLYTDGPLPTVGDEAAHPAVAHFRGEAGPLLGEVAVWVVGPAGYRALGCEDPDCCPAQGRPLTDLQSTQVGAHMVVSGRQVVPSREDLVPTVEVPAGDRRATRRAADRWAARRADSLDPVSVHRWRRAGLAAWREDLARCAGEPGLAIEPTRLGRHLAALDDVLVRDAVLLGLVPGNGRLADRVVAGYSGDEIGRALGAILDPVSGLAPDPVLVDPARHLLVQVAAHASRRRRAPALTLLGLMAWWEGDGARAGIHLDRALGAREDYRLAVLLATTLASGMPPGWVRARGA
ncbi:DUF4192 domain-containing protein [Actinotalea sp.]|uniref:DUF4192 domain-containing protein n=1 Tax=Actinotalea sp. TaxID=1872145 RepID=UPI00356193F2